MDFNKFSQQMLPAIEQELQTIVSERLFEEYSGLHEMMSYHMGWHGEGAGAEAQGKRIRPLIVLLASASISPNWETSLPAAAAIELIHNFSLIHDDIEDNSPLRRGRPTVWKKWGVAQALNTGDAMLTIAHLSLSRLQTQSPSIILHTGLLLQEACLQLTQGQYLDISFENQNTLPIDAYWTMVGGKTAALTACAAAVGALLNGANEYTVKAFKIFGHNLGLAFQIQDDILGIWGDEALTGKSNESDLLTKKKTLPILYALSHDKFFAQKWLEGPILNNEIPDVIRALDACGARTFAEETTNRLTQAALQSLLSATSTSSAIDALLELSNRLLNRAS